jgi:hypothetical protein
MDPLTASRCDPHADPRSFTVLVDRFVNERRYLKNVTPDTIEWYETAFKAFRRALNDDAPPITKASLQTFVVTMRRFTRSGWSCRCSSWRSGFCKR